jgi:hypothetical protein
LGGISIRYNGESLSARNSRTKNRCQEKAKKVAPLSAMANGSSIQAASGVSTEQ